MSPSGSNRLLLALIPFWFLLAVMAARLQTVVLAMGLVAGISAYSVGVKFLDRDLPDTPAIELALVVAAIPVVSAWWTLTDFSVVSGPFSHVRNAISLLVGSVIAVAPLRVGRRRPRPALVGFGAALIALPFVTGGLGTDAVVGCATGGWSSVGEVAYGHFGVDPSGYRVEAVRLSTLTVEWYDGCLPRDGPLLPAVIGVVAIAVGAVRERS